MSARSKIERYFLAHMGEVIETQTLQEVAGILNYSRRVRELRGLGWIIHTHADDSSLRPGQYKPVADPNTDCPERLPSFKVRAMVLERDGGVCQLCGAVAGDIVLGRRVRLTVDHIIPRSKGGSNEPDNLQAHCNVCNEGKGDSLPSPPEYITILTLLRRADKDVLWEVAEWLRGRLWK